MIEEEIRPEELMRENNELLAEDKRKFLDYQDDFVEVACPACQSDEYEVKFAKSGYVFASCMQCRTVYVNPRPTQTMLREFYLTSKSIRHWNDRVFPAAEDARRSNIFQPRAERLAQICRKHNSLMGTLLDVGAGFGTFCEEVSKLQIFQEIIAVEPAASLAQTCREKGLTVIEKPIEEVDLKSADIVTAFELIEHLFDPKKFVQACADISQTGTLLIITTPNIFGFDLMTLGDLSENIAAPEHLNYFNTESLECLLRSCGFEMLETLTPGKLDVEIVRKNILSGNLDVTGQPFLERLLTDRWEDAGCFFQQFLSDNKLSSHLWMVAIKR